LRTQSTILSFWPLYDLDAAAFSRALGAADPDPAAADDEADGAGAAAEDAPAAADAAAAVLARLCWCRLR
jgi:hypothetical protein